MRQGSTLRHVRATGTAMAVVATLLAACGGNEPPPKAPPPPTQQKDPPALRAIGEACARAASCTPRFKDAGACAEWWIRGENPSEPDPFRKCLTGAKSCSDVATCLQGGGDARAAAFCKQRPGVVSGCDGERLVSCGDETSQETTVVDCTSLGASCREVKAAGGMVLRGCVSPQKCPSGAPEARCDGAAGVVQCRDGLLERTTCKAGTRCEEHADDNGDPTASCRIPGARRCALLGGRRCEGDHLIACDGPRFQASDCAGLGLVCTGTGPRASCHVPANVECDPEMVPRCEGGNLVFCVAGRTMKVGCEAIGMAKCAGRSRGVPAACGAQTAE